MNGTGTRTHRLGPFSSRPLDEAQGGFTLLELIVILAMLGVMASLLLPALAATDPNAKTVRCLNNQKHLAMAIDMYAVDYNDSVDFYRAAGGYWTPPGSPPWSGLPVSQVTGMVKQALTNSTSNFLSPYAPRPELFHCPADLRANTQLPGQGWAYDSYSKTDNVGGTGGWGDVPYSKLGQVRTPAMTFLTIEEADPRGYNHGSWIVQWNAGTIPGSFTWVDTPAIYHVNAASFSFADGHAEMHRWSDPTLIAAGLKSASGSTGGYNFSGPTSGPDYEYVRLRYQSQNWR